MPYRAAYCLLSKGRLYPVSLYTIVAPVALYPGRFGGSNPTWRRRSSRKRIFMQRPAVCLPHTPEVERIWRVVRPRRPCNLEGQYQDTILPAWHWSISNAGQVNVCLRGDCGFVVVQMLRLKCPAMRSCGGIYRIHDVQEEERSTADGGRI